MAAKTPYTLANERISFDTAMAWAGTGGTGTRDRGVKAACPSCGEAGALRVYPNHGWCVDTETEILTRRGWLRWNEVVSGDWALTYRDQATRWEPVQTVIRLPAARRRMLSMETRTHSSLTTEGHRWLVRSGSSPRVYTSTKRLTERKPWERFTTSADGFKSGDYIPFIGGPCATLPEVPRHTDAFVELVAWFFTEGSVWKSGGNSFGAIIHQSHRVNPENCARIRTALTACYGEPSDCIGKTHGWREAPRVRKGMTEFILSTAISGDLLRAAPGKAKVVTPQFVISLTRAQLLLFVETALDADGCRVGSWSQLCQKERARLDAFQMALLLLGRPARIWRRENSGTRLNGQKKAPDWACQLLTRQNMQPSRNSEKVKWVEHDGPVWCVTTPSGTWVARRNGTTYVTGNCFSEGRYFTPVTLLAEAWGMDRDEAAVLALRKIGYVAAGYADLWEKAERAPEPALDQLAEALRIYCARACPDWAVRQYDDAVAGTMARCLGLLRSVRTEDDCRKWLAVSKTVMGRVLSRH